MNLGSSFYISVPSEYAQLPNGRPSHGVLGRVRLLWNSAAVGRGAPTLPFRAAAATPTSPRPRLAMPAGTVPAWPAPLARPRAEGAPMSAVATVAGIIRVIDQVIHAYSLVSRGTTPRRRAPRRFGL